MTKAVVIVESPAKCKTITKYLGKGFTVLASYGHVRDLPKSKAIDIDHDFAMNYVPIERNKPRVDAIIKALKTADTLYLATDPDREGEAISWHLHELLTERKALKDKTVHRIVFHQITRAAVQAAIADPHEIRKTLVDAQQGRRGLDRLVGFTLSPLLWEKIRRGLSAGRVQSPANRMIVEREAEIDAFESKEYWSILANTQHEQQAFKAKLTRYKKTKVSQFSITNEKDAKEAKASLLNDSQGKLIVSHVEKKQRKRRPAPPFTTSTLQQEAARKLGFSTSRTMRTAQKLYEGINVGHGEEGLISYMRTDSVNLAAEAIQELRTVIENLYGEALLPNTPQHYKTKAKSAQEAHEAIRPTHPAYHPDKIKDKLTNDQAKLYRLIWQRAIACQMIPATLDTVAIDLNCGKDHQFRANGSVITQPGFLSVYEEGKDDTKETVEGQLPALTTGDILDLLAIETKQHFTEPPPRYTEASLVKALEKHGIGRPSTYAAIIDTLQSREYVILENKRFHPTDIGKIVNQFLTQYFTQYVDYDFTAKLEDQLDNVARGEEALAPLLQKFWGPFIKTVEEIKASVDRKSVTEETLDEKCPECQGALSIRLGRRGRFIGCEHYPDCRYTRSLEADTETEKVEEELVADRNCPKCSSPLVIKHGRYGKFIGCQSYPTCKHIEPLNAPEDTGVSCPQCNSNNLLKRQSRRGKMFFGCAGYPKCDYAAWYPPLKQPCPKCNWPILVLKTTKRYGEQKICPQKDCGYVEGEENKTTKATTTKTKKTKRKAS